MFGKWKKERSEYKADVDGLCIFRCFVVMKAKYTARSSQPNGLSFAENAESLTDH